MANLVETEVWTEGIYQLETSDPVMGGVDGIDNRQAQQLANRTCWLRKQGETSALSIDTHAQQSNPHSDSAPLQSPEFTGIPTAPTAAITTKNKQLATTEFVFNAVQGTVVVVSDIPSSKLSDVIYVIRKCQTMFWVQTAHYTGYRSSECGRVVFGHTPSPLPFELDLKGGIITGVSYPSLVARFRESALVKPVAQYLKGEYALWEMTGGQFRLPNLEDQFLRFTGVDADNANARVLGSHQADATQKITGQLTDLYGGTLASGLGPFAGTTAVQKDAFMMGGGTLRRVITVTYDNSSVARTSTETRASNTAFAPRIVAF